MNDKEKQIEEMAKDIQNAVNGCAKYWAEVIAKYLVEQGYRKLPKDNVVLSKEELENIYEQAEQTVLANIADGGTSCHWCIEQHEKKASKETAEMYHTLMNDCIKSNLNIRKNKNTFAMALGRDNDELAKQFGVEIKE